MHSFMVLATAAALIVTGTAATDAAPRKKLRALIKPPRRR